MVINQQLASSKKPLLANNRKAMAVEMASQTAAKRAMVKVVNLQVTERIANAQHSVNIATSFT